MDYFQQKEVRKIILKDKFFWPSVIYAIKTTKTLVEVLRLVNADKEPAMSSLYNAMDLAKEKNSEKQRRKRLKGDMGNHRSKIGISVTSTFACCCILFESSLPL